VAALDVVAQLEQDVVLVEIQRVGLSAGAAIGAVRALAVGFVAALVASLKQCGRAAESEEKSKLLPPPSELVRVLVEPRAKFSR
jgi:hypothetical protein